MRLTNFQQHFVSFDVIHKNAVISTRAVALSLRSHTSAWWSWRSKAAYLDSKIVPYSLSKASGSTWIRTIPRVPEGGVRGDTHLGNAHVAVFLVCRC
jgi:hypothetical protein